jgi:hypothetical protein
MGNEQTTYKGYIRGLFTLLKDLAARIPAALGANGGLPIEGVASGVAVPVSGPLTDTQIRATALPVTPAATELHLGEVAGSGAVPALATVVRPATTTTYAANDVITTLLAIIGASNATPIEVQTSAAHGLVTGNAVTVAGCVGNTGANGNWLITVTAADKFTLDGSVGNGAWSSGGTVAQCLRFIDIARVNGGLSLIMGGIVNLDEYQALALMARLMIFNAQPTTAGDNLAFAPTDAEMRTWIGSIDFINAPVPGNATAGATGNCALQMASQGLVAKCAASSKDLFGVLLALNAYVPLASTTVNVRIKAMARS